MRAVVVTVLVMSGCMLLVNSRAFSQDSPVTEVISRAGTLVNVPPGEIEAISRAGTLVNVPPGETEAISRSGSLVNVSPGEIEAISRTGSLVNVPPGEIEAISRAGSLVNVPPGEIEAISRSGSLVNVSPGEIEAISWAGTLTNVAPPSEALSRAGTVANFQGLLAIWTGAAGDSSYSTPGNWDVGIVPVNNDTTRFSVVVPAGEYVAYDLTSAAGVDSLSLGEESSFVMAPGDSLSVFEGGAFSGTIAAAGPSFLAVEGTSTLLSGFRMFLSGSATATIEAPGYVHGVVPSGPILSVDGTDTFLQLQSLTSYEDSVDFGGTETRSIIASNGGTLDLSSLTTIAGPPTTTMNALEVSWDSLSYVFLENLTTIERVTFELDLARGDSLPSLIAASGTTLDLGPNTVLNLPVANTFEDVTLTLGPGAALVAPSLVTYLGSLVDLDPANTVTTGPLADIDGSRIHVSGGLQYSAIVDTSYVYFNYPDTTQGQIFSSAGPGTILDLSSLKAFEDCYDPPGGPHTRSILARNKGHIDLSGVTTLAGAPLAGNERFRIRAMSGGSIDLQALTTITKVVDVSVDDSTSYVWVGDLDLDDFRRITLTNGGRLRVGSRFTHKHTDSLEVSTEDGVLEFVGPETGYLEAASEDSGAGGGGGGFGIGELIVGSGIEAKTLILLDQFDNSVSAPLAGTHALSSSASGSEESLYLVGREGRNGLQLLGGSTLVVPTNLNVYVQLDTAMIRLNDLFESGAEVPFGDGTLVEGGPTTSVEDVIVPSTTFMAGYPNPFKGRMTLSYGVPAPGPVRLSIFSVTGALVIELVNESDHPAGVFSRDWSATDMFGRRVSSGAYFIQGRIGPSRYSSKIIMLR